MYSGFKVESGKAEDQTGLDNLPLLHITANISQTTINLIDSYSNSHGLFIADALIAASALENDLTLVTYNIGDLKFINGLKYLEPTI